jgi:membrane protein DedA with SNARE-associated domain
MSLDGNIRAILLLLVVSGVIIYFYKRLGYLGVFLASLVGSATIILPLPVSPVVSAAGAVLIPLFVALVAATGATIGDLNGYFFGQRGEHIKPNDFATLQSFMHDYGFFTLLVLAAIPGHDLVGLLAGYNQYPIRLFLLATFLGTFIKFLGFAHAGKTLAKHRAHFF